MRSAIVLKELEKGDHLVNSMSYEPNDKRIQLIEGIVLYSKDKPKTYHRIGKMVVPKHKIDQLEALDDLPSWEDVEHIYVEVFDQVSTTTNITQGIFQIV